MNQERAQIRPSAIRIRYIMELILMRMPPEMLDIQAGTEIVIPSYATSAIPAKRMLRLA
jgi:hypothetical protein